MAKGLLRSTFTVSCMTTLSRIMGFIRDMILAQIFGASAEFDAFLVAFRVPNFMRRLFAEGAFSQAFVPVLSEYRQRCGEEDIKQFINRISGSLSLSLFVVTLIAVVLSPLITMVFAPGFINEPHRFGLTSAMLRVTFPYLFFISLTAFAGAVLNSYGRFAIPSFTPVLLNFSLIAAAIYLAPHFKEPVEALAWGVFLAGVVQLLFQIPFLGRLGLLPRPKLVWRDEGVRRVMRLMVPALFGVSVAQLSLFIDTMFASFLPIGSVTWLYYSDRLTQFPLGIFGVALSTVILPHLSRKHADRSVKEFSAGLDWALRSVLIIGVPAGLGLLILSGPLLATLFQYGKFSTFDVQMTQRSLMAFSVGIPSFMLVKVLASGFYSRQDIKTPVRIAVIALVTNMLLNLALIFPLAHAGLALATTLASSLNAILLWRILLKRSAYQPCSGWGKYSLQLLFANGALATFLIVGSPKLARWLSWGWHERGFRLSLLLMGATGIYFICLWIGGIRLKHFGSSRL